MKNRLFALAVLALSLVLVSGGCFGNTWRVSFAQLDNYDDWIFSPSGDYWEHVAGIGVRLSGTTMSSPVAFTGDFTMTVLFTLNTDADETVYFGFYPGDSRAWTPSNAISSFFDDIGSETGESWWVDDIGSTFENVVAESGTSLPSLLRKGPNSWKMIKQGNHIQIFMNFYKVADFTMTHCAAAYYNVVFYSDLIGGGDLIFNSVKLQYKGSII
jgi:hypothetical protein